LLHFLSFDKPLKSNSNSNNGLQSSSSRLELHQRSFLAVKWSETIPDVKEVHLNKKVCNVEVFAFWCFWPNPRRLKLCASDRKKLKLTFFCSKENVLDVVCGKCQAKKILKKKKKNETLTFSDRTFVVSIFLRICSIFYY
jgi:hypothetical protein